MIFNIRESKVVHLTCASSKLNNNPLDQRRKRKNKSREAYSKFIAESSWICSHEQICME